MPAAERTGEIVLQAMVLSYSHHVRILSRGLSGSWPILPLVR
jgi:hypothetical protein